VISATIVLTGHAKCFDVLKFCHGCNLSLLQDPCIGNVFSIGSEISKLEGCYLYWDKRGKRFIRSGKVSGGLRGENGGRTFAQRDREHKKGSELKCFQDRQSKFYTKYPSTDSASKSTEPWGYFENLIQFSGFAIDRTKKTLVESICEEANGFMRWPKNTIQRLSKDGSIRGNEMVNAKLELVAYLYELAYDLCISQQDNVSQSPGFEKYLGQFGRGREE
jgi:hypothetical protein